MNHRKHILFILFIFVLSLLTGCGKQASKVAPVNNTASILLFDENTGSAELVAYFNDGNVPEEANILYDQMGSNPDVTITDTETIKELYRLLSMVEVTGKSNTSITDSYHHIRFKLSEDRYVNYAFEGSSLWCYKGENYDIQNSGKLFRYMQEITEEYCQQES